MSPPSLNAVDFSDHGCAALACWPSAQPTLAAKNIVTIARDRIGSILSYHPSFLALELLLVTEGRR
jgi:hypothetical protein